MNLENVKYDAFISYRHKDLDQFVAVTLHKELEAFRLPKKLQKSMAKNGMTKKKIERVFRDRDELPITNNLADPIMNALSNSEYLLVICTPRLPESIWCKTEVENFIKMHGRERVFAVLAEGEPAESFPEALLYEEKEVEDENGNKVVKRVPVEPLAADVRGASKKEIRKKIKEEVLRLAAPMFDCSYDDLKQRHREQKIKRIITASLSATAVFGAFAVVSTTMALQIHKQSGQIKEQAAKIEEQYTEALKVNAKAMAEDALDLVDRGDKKGATEIAYRALTGTEEEPMPYTADAEYALSEALMVYKDGYAAIPVEVLEFDGQISSIVTSPSSTKFMAADIYGNIKVYEPATGKLWAELEAEEENTYLRESEFAFLTENEIVYPYKDGVVIYNLDTQEQKNVELSGRSYNVSTSSDGKYLLCNHFDGVSIFNGSTLEEIMFIDSKEYDINFDFFISSDEDYAIASYKAEDKVGILIVNLITKELCTYEAKYDGISTLYMYKDDIYVASYSSDIFNTKSAIACVDKQGNEKWIYDFAGSVSRMQTFGVGERDKLAFYGYGIVSALSMSDGSLVAESVVGTEDIVEMACYKDSDSIAYMTRGGVMHFFAVDNNTDYIMDQRFYSNSDNLKCFCYGNQYMVSSAYNDECVTVYKYAKGSNLKEFAATEQTIMDVEVSTEGELMAVYLSERDTSPIQIMNAETAEVYTTVVSENMILDMKFNPEGKLVVLTTDEIFTFDPKSGDELGKVTLENDLKNIRYVSEGMLIENGKKAVIQATSGIFVLNASEGEIENELLKEELQIEGSFLFDVSEDGLTYCYTDQTKKATIVGTFEKGNKIEIPMNVKVLDAVSYLDGILYTTHMNGKVISYDVETGEALKTYDGFNVIVKDALKMNDYTILSSGYSAYLLNAEREVVGNLEDFSAFDAQNDCFYFSSSYDIYKVPRYSLDMLIEEAEQMMKK